MRVRTRNWFSLVIAASILFIAGSRLAFFEPMENAVLIIAAPVESALRDATRPVADFVNNLTDVNRLTGQNQNLREENEQLNVDIARLREVERRFQEQERFLENRVLASGDTFVTASVFANEPSNVSAAIAIGRGTSDGLQEGMVVLSPQGSLVGTISRVLKDSAWVTLITDQTSAVSSLIQESRAQGVVVGAADGTLTMEFVEETADVKEGDFVITSSIGGRYPSGELIGRVIEVGQASPELFLKVRIEPVADLLRLEYVHVLVSFLPQAEDGP